MANGYGTPWGSALQGLNEGLEKGMRMGLLVNEARDARQQREEKKKEQEITRASQMFDMVISAAPRRTEEETVADANTYGRKIMGDSWVDWKTYGTAEQRLAKGLQKIQEQIQAGTISATRAESEVINAYIEAGKDNPEIGLKLLGITQAKERQAQYVKNKSYELHMGLLSSGNKEERWQANEATPGANPETIAYKALNSKAYDEGRSLAIEDFVKLRKVEIQDPTSPYRDWRKQNPTADVSEYYAMVNKSKRDDLSDISGDESLDVADGGLLPTPKSPQAGQLTPENYFRALIEEMEPNDNLGTVMQTFFEQFPDTTMQQFNELLARTTGNPNNPRNSTWPGTTPSRVGTGRGPMPTSLIDRARMGLFFGK